jgi:DNA-binding transcriptional regulator YhcF (GntR family)
MYRGFVALHRKFVEWEWYQDPNTMRLFIHLLLTVNWEPKKWRGTTIKRGEKITSLQNLAKEMGLSLQSVRTSIKKLKSTGELTSQSTSKFTKLTLINYDFYQTKKTEATSQLTSQSTNEQQTSNKRVTTTKQLKPLETLEQFKEKQEKEKSPKKSAPVFEIPESLNNDDFLAAWAEWQEHRKQIKKKLTPLAAKKQLKMLSEIGVSKAIAAIDHSIKNGWQGIFEPKQKNAASLDADITDQLEERYGKRI